MRVTQKSTAFWCCFMDCWLRFEGTCCLHTCCWSLSWRKRQV